MACSIPFLKLPTGILLDTLGPDPVADITHTTGIWALNLILATLAITPLRQLTGWHWLIRWRRNIALLGFFYASLHLLSYLLFEQSFDFAEIGQDIFRRPYIAAGFLAFLLMVPLATTSSNAMIRRMGGRNWKALHRLIYPAGIAAVFHYFWLVKRDVTIPSYYALILLALLFARLPKRAAHLPRKPTVCPTATLNHWKK